MRCAIDSHEDAEVLLAYCARKLDPARTAILESHIAVCPACREFAAAQQAVWSALEAWEGEPVSADFDRRFYRRIEQEGSVSIWERLMRPFRPVLVRQGLPIAAAACLLVTAGILLERPSQVSPANDNQVQVESVQPDQLDRALEDIEMLSDFHQAVRSDARPNAI